MDMTLDELYEAYLGSIRKADLKLNRKEKEETENRNEHERPNLEKDRHS